jgi:hypothetical protein
LFIQRRRHEVANSLIENVPGRGLMLGKGKGC